MRLIVECDAENLTDIFREGVEFFCAANRRPSQTYPGRARSTTRADGPSGLMKVRSIADFSRERCCAGLGGSVPEKPVMTASPRFKFGGRLACCAVALPQTRQSNRSGKSRVTMLNNIPPVDAPPRATPMISNYNFLQKLAHYSGFDSEEASYLTQWSRSDRL
ncbi:MAG TPA: hypothetical protein VD863_22895 [Bradyrhizobium sp.]|nr:hypothetical protein [Bradyrhizobium sp.]